MLAHKPSPGMTPVTSLLLAMYVTSSHTSWQTPTSVWWAFHNPSVGAAANILRNLKQFSTETQGEAGLLLEIKSAPLECILFENAANRRGQRHFQS